MPFPHHTSHITIIVHCEYKFTINALRTPTHTYTTITTTNTATTMIIIWQYLPFNISNGDICTVLRGVTLTQQRAEWVSCPKRITGRPRDPPGWTSSTVCCKPSTHPCYCRPPARTLRRDWFCRCYHHWTNIGSESYGGGELTIWSMYVWKQTPYWYKIDNRRVCWVKSHANTRWNGSTGIAGSGMK